jgi:steroid delta-isomerase-like uncharacterized protein
MSLEENKALARRMVAAIAQGDDAELDAVLAPDVLAHDPGVEFRGSAQLKKGVVHFRAAFPDMRFSIDDLIAEDDRVAIRYAGQATHQGEFRGVAATGKRFTYTGMMMIRVAGGKIVEYWASPDQLGVFRQLGAYPAL